MSVDAKNSEWEGFNCFAYAISGKFATLRDDLPKSPGFISRSGLVLDRGATIPTNVNKLNTKLQEDGFRKHRLTEGFQAESGHYLVAAYIDQALGYHFIRQDFDGNWSHKFGWGNPPKSLGQLTHEQLANPLFLNDDKSKYYFAGIYSVPDEGLSKERASYSERIANRPQVLQR